MLRKFDSCPIEPTKVTELFGSEKVDWSCSNSVIQDQNLSQIYNTLKQAQRYKYARSSWITYVGMFIIN